MALNRKKMPNYLHAKGLIPMLFLFNFMYGVFQADTRAMKLNIWKQLASEEGM